MDQAEGVSQFVHRLFHHTVMEERDVDRKPVEFLPEPRQRDDRCRAVELRMTEDETEHRYKKIMFSDTQDAHGIIRFDAEQFFQ